MAAAAASDASKHVIKTFFVTLRRSPIGTPWFHRRVLDGLGLQRRHDCVERPNNASVRGQLFKVAHLVRIESDRMFYARKVAEAEAASLKPPIRVAHGSGGGSSSGSSSGSKRAGGGAGLQRQQ